MIELRSSGLNKYEVLITLINEIIEGDSLSVLKKIDDKSIDAIISDIPYGISYEEWDILHNNTNSALLGSSSAQKKAGQVFKHRGKPLNGWSEADKKIAKEYQNWCETWASEWLRVLKPGASAFIFAGRRMAPRCICALEDAGFTFKDMIAWIKDKAPHRAQRISIVYNRRNDHENEKKWEGWRVGNLRPIFEPILWFVKPYTLGGTLADNVRDYNVGAFNNESWKKYTPDCSNVVKVIPQKYDHGYHTAQKPIELLKSLIELTTMEQQTILDPFCGSGSTLVAAAELNRNYIGIDSNREYVEIAKRRLQDTKNSVNKEEVSNEQSLF